MEAIDADRLAQVYRFHWIHGSDRLASTLAPDEALVEEQFAKAHGIAVGDTFSIRTPSGGARAPARRRASTATRSSSRG